MRLLAGLFGLCVVAALSASDARPDSFCCPAVTLDNPKGCDTVGLVFIASGQYAPSPLPCGATIESTVYDSKGKVLSTGTAKAKGGAWAFTHTIPAGAGYEVEAVMKTTTASASVGNVTAK